MENPSKVGGRGNEVQRSVSARPRTFEPFVDGPSVSNFCFGLMTSRASPPTLPRKGISANLTEALGRMVFH